MSDMIERLPRRDWLILPLLSLLTVLLIIGAAEIVTRAFWAERVWDSCSIPDKALHYRYKPNCVARVKGAEGPWVENAYNECGFRTAEHCGPKVANEFRVAVVGASISAGYLVPYPETFAARTTALLGELCHVPVDFQNLGVPGADMQTVPAHLDAALSLHPDLILMALSAHDIEVVHDQSATASEEPRIVRNQWVEAARQVAIQLRQSRAVLVAQHFLYQNLDAYLPLYLSHGDEADFLRSPLSPPWKARLSVFDREVAEIASRSRAVGVPFMLMYVPLRPQALLMQWKHKPADIDPTWLGRALGEIAQRNGAAYLDLTETIGERPDMIDLYFPVDSHPNAAASAIIADSLARALLAEAPALASCRNRTQASR
jgi:hypothetical protein